MRSKQKKKSHVRSFERDARVQRLVEAGIIKSADEIPADAIPADAIPADAIPADAIPAGVEYIQRTRSSYGLHSRPPYYRDIEFCCEDCGKQSFWSADDQRHWYEQLHGSPYGTAKRCSECRRKRKGVRS
jgi:hypothetical protein